jgi:hypothetical protein
VLTLASVKARSTGPKAGAPGLWRQHGGPGRREREDDSVPPIGAARYGGSKAARTSWAHHGTTLGYGAGDVGATAPPARRRRRGARLQLLGGDAGLLGGSVVGVPPASSGLRNNKKKTPRGTWTGVRQRKPRGARLPFDLLLFPPSPPFLR